MAAGIQRNDAAAFVRTFHKIKALGMTNLFPEMDTAIPELPFKIHQETAHPIQLRSEYSMDRMDLQLAGSIDFVRFIKKRLIDSIVHEIRESNVVKFTKREMDWQVCLVAQLDVLPPVAVEGEDVWF